MQLIQVLSVSLTTGVSFDSAIVEYWRYHGVNIKIKPGLKAKLRKSVNLRAHSCEF